MNLTAAQISENYEKFISRIDKIFKTRAPLIKKMYEDLGERVIFAPGSSFAHFHNAFPGGYVDHILRVMDYSILVHKQWESGGLKNDNYTLEELMFAAMHHDLGKLGMPIPGGEHYIMCQSEWHRKNQGKEFETNPHLPNATFQDRSLFLLQHYGITCSWNEWLAIRIHDGVYDEANKQYYLTFNVSGKLRTNMPIILHHADMMASRFEFERWAIETKSFNMDPIETSNFKFNTPSISSEKTTTSKGQLAEKLANEMKGIFNQ